MTKKSLLILSIILSFAFNSSAQTFKQYLKAGEKAFSQGEYFAAIAYLEQAKTFNQNKDEVNYKIGQAYFELKDYENAIKNFNKVKSKSSILSVFYEMGQCFMHIGDYKQAISNFEKFKNNYRENDFKAKDAEQKLASCFWASDHLELEKDILVESLGENINSEFSEFSPSLFKDSLLQVTSFFQDEEDKRNDYISDILFFEKAKKDWKEVALSFPTEKNKQLANGFYLEEKKRFYFNQCEQTSQGKRRCDLYVSQFENEAWSTPVYLNINDKNYTSTQPFVYVNDEGKDVILYVSNKEGSKGGNDIFDAVESSYAVFDKHYLLAVLDKVNSVGDEASPYFDKANQTLYFSSNYHYGFGGYDIFKIDLFKKNAKIKNLGLPYNSSANDLYFKEYEAGKSFFSSNREGAMRLRGAACCYDIFTIEKDEKQILARLDSISTLDSLIVVNQKDSVKKLLSEIKEMLPLSVYFHNDEPNPKSIDTTTNLSYEDAFKSFVSLKDTYYIQNEFKEIDAFFYDKLEAGFSDLKSFEKLLSSIIGNHKIKLELSGYCSPLADSKYNYFLSKRRISSIENYLNQNAVLKKAISSGQLQIVEIPYGEEKADKSISDNYFNTKKSVFSTEAALSRKVAIVGILID